MKFKTNCLGRSSGFRVAQVPGDLETRSVWAMSSSVSFSRTALLTLQAHHGGCVSRARTHLRPGTCGPGPGPHALAYPSLTLQCILAGHFKREWGSTSTPLRCSPPGVLRRCSRPLFEEAAPTGGCRVSLVGACDWATKMALAH